MERYTRTVNPLPFQDLEPHRFEDLVRQLIYDFRNWASIEAVGRQGSDEGIDIRAIERTMLTDTTEPEIDEDEDDDLVDTRSEDRTWIIQCKRERRITPKKIAGIVSDNISNQDSVPHGYIIAAACDFSKAARDAFRREVVQHGVQEFFLLGKAELEDMLFLPKNDHLLFAYFGISLQIRRRSMRTLLRSRMTLKRKLVKELGQIIGQHSTPVLIRDPRVDNYPYLPEASKTGKKNIHGSIGNLYVICQLTT